MSYLDEQVFVIAPESFKALSFCADKETVVDAKSNIVIMSSDNRSLVLSGDANTVNAALQILESSEQILTRLSLLKRLVYDLDFPYNCITDEEQHLQASIDTIQHLTYELTKERDYLLDQVSDLENDIDNAKDDISHLESNIEDLQYNISSLEKENQELEAVKNQEIRCVELQLEETLRRIQELENQIGS
jgi:chromosome segregation ATPase